MLDGLKWSGKINFHVLIYNRRIVIRNKKETEPNLFLSIIRWKLKCSVFCFWIKAFMPNKTTYCTNYKTNSLKIYSIFWVIFSTHIWIVNSAINFTKTHCHGTLNSYPLILHFSFLITKQWKKIVLQTSTFFHYFSFSNFNCI